MHGQRIVGLGIVLGTIFVLLLIVAGVTQHPASLEGSGIGLLWTDFAWLAGYCVVGIMVWRRAPASSMTAAVAGAQVGLLVGAVGIANHVIEAFIPARPFVLVISPVLLTLALLGMAGALAWERTESLLLAVIGGICCGMVAALITLGFAISFNLLFASHVDSQLREAFAASGMIDRAGFRVRNILEASSEILLQMPVMAICLAFAGAVIQAWMSRESRRPPVVAFIVLAPFVFVLGVVALRHADTIERAARPPFVLCGVLLTAVALCSAYPIWSALRRGR
jgi:hypothetical protein